MGGKPNQGTTTAPITTTVTKTPEIPKNEPTISMEEFTKIKNGMTYQEAVTLIGSE